jgi:phage gpG-like protein
VETTPKTMRFKVFPIGKAKKYAYILNYGGTSRNKWSGDGLTVQKQRQFAYLNSDDRLKITDLYARYILDLIGGKR